MVTKKTGTSKKSASKKSTSKGEESAASVSNTCLVVIIALLLVLVGLSVACVTMIAMGQQDAKEREKRQNPGYVEKKYDFDAMREREEWIDCMPILSDEEVELCELAQEAGYPYIAY